MLVDVTVPSVGESVSEGELATWMVADGGYVEKGADLFEMETDKASTPVPAPESGVVRHLVPAKTKIAIGAKVAQIDTSAKAGAKKEAAVAAPASVAPAAAQAAGEKVLATSVARKIAEENNIDLRAVRGSGPHGRVTREDVETKMKEAPKAEAKHAAVVAAPAPVAAKVVPAPAGAETRERMSTIRRRIAERLVQAQHNAAMLTTFNDVDMGAVMELRKQYKDSFKEKHGVGLGFMSFFAKACIEALRTYPRVNAFIDGEDIVFHHAYHLGVAVSTERGLVVPVLRNAENLSFAQIEQKIVEFAGRARDGKIEVAEMQGGTFTITNGGVFGSMLSTPILNPPQSGILGMHRIEDRPVVRNGQIVARPMMYLALTYDHRIVDGKEAVGFLVKVKECIENPARMLLGV